MLEGELGVIDYLLKPIAFSSFFGSGSESQIELQV
jgi:response regulator of citrate/malate metabolism